MTVKQLAGYLQMPVCRQADLGKTYIPQNLEVTNVFRPKSSQERGKNEKICLLAWVVILIWHRPNLN